jgi:hypothetical protein
MISSMAFPNDHRGLPEVRDDFTALFPAGKDCAESVVAIEPDFTRQ